MLTLTETEQLRAATLFLVPVPRAVLAVAGVAASVVEPERAIDRLLGIGLLDLYLAPNNAEEAAVNPLVRPMVQALSEAATVHLATATILPLYASWKDIVREPWGGQRGLEAARLALLGKASAEIVNATAQVGTVFLFHRALDAEKGLELVIAALTALDRAAAVPDLDLLRLGAHCAERLGKTDIQQMLLDRGLRIEKADPRARAMLLSDIALRLVRTGDIDTAERLLNEAAASFAALEDERSRAIAMGRIADILASRGQLDQALKIHREEELAVYERLLDTRERAVTMGKIAEILWVRGQRDEALKIYNEDVLPAMERSAAPATAP
jgi:tetratricopeptide (TPR) repeat protein